MLQVVHANVKPDDRHPLQAAGSSAKLLATLQLRDGPFGPAPAMKQNQDELAIMELSLVSSEPLAHLRR